MTEGGVGSLGVAVAAASLGAVAAGAIRRGPAGRAASWWLVPPILFAPLLIPAASPGLRAAAACLSGDLAMTMVDAFRRRGRVGWGFGAYLRSLVPFPVFAVVAPDLRRRLARPDRAGPLLRRVAGGVAGVALGVGLAVAKRGVPAFRSSPWLDHAAMLAVFVLTIESLSRALHGLERLAGYDVAPIIRRAYTARSAAGFWRLYNGRVHLWLGRHVFRPCGGTRNPARGVFRVFLVSGLFHEVMFDVATAKVTGYQLAFFLLQAPAVLASPRLERLAARPGVGGAAAARGLTVAFLAVTSVLFFRGVADIFPFIYAGRPPLP